MAATKDIALALHANNLAVVPIRMGTKIPACRGWKKYQNTQTKEDVINLFRTNTGIAIIGGAHGIECIDIDSKNSLDADFVTNLLKAIVRDLGEAGKRILASSMITKTPSGGSHIIFRCNHVEGNQKLAANKNGEVTIETRGKGGYFLVPPSNGYLIMEGSFDKIGYIGTLERQMLFDVLRSFDLSEKEEFNKVRRAAQKKRNDNQDSDTSPFKDFNESNDALDIFIENGWEDIREYSDKIYLRRPGGSKTVHAVYYLDSRVVYVHTTNARVPAERNYSAYQAYTYFNHDGDFKESAKALFKLGYGKETSLEPKQNDDKAPEGRMAEIFNKTKFDIYTRPPEVQHILFYGDKGLASYGDIIGIIGPMKSSKSAVCTSIMGSGLQSNKAPLSTLGFFLDIGNKNIVHLDTEQQPHDIYKLGRRLMRITKKDTLSNYHPFQLNTVSIKERFQFLDYIFTRIDNIGLIVIDGIVDMVASYNDEKESRAFFDKLINLCTTHKTLCICVLHEARSTGRARGHLGGELENKAKLMISQKVNEAIMEECNDTFELRFTAIRGGARPKAFEWEYEDGIPKLFIK